jgi:DNA recombination protein RmuC
LESTSRQLNERLEQVSQHVNQQLTQLSEHVEQRLSTGFQSTNETFTRVMSRLATIDEAQKKIEGLTSNVISLNQLLGDKRARGALGEVQLEALVRNSLPPASYRFQSPIPNHPTTRPDCLLILPEPTGNLVIDAKFPLENYQRSTHPDATAAEKAIAAKAFQNDIRRHIDAVASKYILPPDTSDSAMLFIPAESIFADIHGNYPELVTYSQEQRVWLVSPTTLMAVLNTARAVIRDRETREHIHSIQNALKLLSMEFGRFDERMQKLAKHIKQVSDDVDNIHVTSHKISRQFRHIEAADIKVLTSPEALATAMDETESMPIQEDEPLHG